VAAALKELFAKFGMTPAFAMLAPDGQLPAAGYTLFIETRDGELPPDLPGQLDKALRQNPHYAYCRDLNQLARPRIFRVRASAYLSYVRAYGERGRRIGELKPVALGAETNWADRFDGAYV
jgi:hypothetical protein